MAELWYPLERQIIQQLRDDDAYYAPSFNALKLLAKDGHECVFMHGVPDGHQGVEIIDGVTVVYVHGEHDGTSTFTSFKPDVMIASTWPSGVYGLFAKHNSWTQFILMLCCETKTSMQPADLAMYRRASTIVCSMPYEIEFLKIAGIQCEIVSHPHGVNMGMTDRYFTKDKQYDIGLSIRHPIKGYALAEKALYILKDRGFSIHPRINIVDMKKSDYLKELGSVRYIFNPSATEGCSRTITEAVRLGVIPIVSTDSQNVCYHLRKFKHHEVRTWCWFDNRIGKSCFPADPKEVADSIESAIMSDSGFVHDKPVDMGYGYDASHEAESLANLARRLIPS